MKQITLLEQDESVHLDLERIESLYMQLGPSNAEDIVCRALEELAARLTHAERCYSEWRIAELRKGTRGLIAIADQIGMQLLAKVAGDVTDCIDRDDQVALGATFARLLRIGERSLGEISHLNNLATI